MSPRRGRGRGWRAGSHGECLPCAGHLAAVLGVNRNTVLRALRLLREEGVPDRPDRRK